MPFSYRSRTMRSASRACVTAARPTLSRARAASRRASVARTSSRTSDSASLSRRDASRWSRWLGDPGAVGQAVEQVDFQLGSHEPAGRPVGEGVAVPFPAALQADLGHETRARHGLRVPRRPRAGWLQGALRAALYSLVLDRAGRRRRVGQGHDGSSSKRSSSRGAHDLVEPGPAPPARPASARMRCARIWARCTSSASTSASVTRPRPAAVRPGHIVLAVSTAEARPVRNASAIRPGEGLGCRHPQVPARPVPS